jgi:hypothetical protein
MKSFETKTARPLVLLLWRREMMIRAAMPLRPSKRLMTRAAVATPAQMTLDFSDDTIGGYEGDGDTGGTEPGGGGDAFDASSSYVNQAITNFQASPAAQQSVGVMATPMSAATVGAGF